MNKTAVIRKCKKGDAKPGKPWCLYTHDGSKLLGTHPSKNSALEQERAIKSKGANFKVEAPKKPPKDWWDKHYKEVKEGNPSYSDEQIRKTVGDIWYNKMSPGQKKERVRKEKGSLRVEAPGRPPKDWWNKMEGEVKKDNPDYSDEQVKKTIGDIWYNKLSQYRRNQLTKKHESRLYVEAAYSHSFSPDFYGDIYSWTSNGPRPTNVADAIQAWWESDRKSFMEMVKELFPHWAEYTTEYLSESLMAEIMDRILETNTVGTLKPPVDVWIDPEGDYTVDVWDERDERDSRVQAVQARVEGERVAAIKTRVEGANFPNLFSADTRKWIELQTRNLASNMGPIASPEQAIAFVNDAAKQVISQISEAVKDEVTKIIDAEKENILKEIVTEETTFEEEPMAPPPAPQIPMEMAEEPAPAPAAPVPEQVAAAFMPHKLRIAFEKSANPAEQSLALVRLDPNFLSHLDELEEQAESVERLAEWIKDYMIGRGLIDQTLADQADWLSPTKQLTANRGKDESA